MSGLLRSSYDIFYPSPLPAAHYKVGLAVMTWNRPGYLRRFLLALSKCHLPDTVIMLIDDSSTDAKTQRLFKEYQHPQAPVIKCRAQWHRGFYVHERVRFAWDFLSQTYGCDYLTNLDSDVIMRSDWLQRIEQLYQREVKRRGDTIISGFNKHFGISLEEHKDHNVKRFLGGANMFFSKAIYYKVVRAAIQMHWDDFVVESMYQHGYQCLTTRPSCIQHIGMQGLFSSHIRYDFASDYSWLSRLHILRLVVGIKRKIFGTNPLWFLSRLQRDIDAR